MMPKGARRSTLRQAIDFFTFPLRAFMPFKKGANKWLLSSRESERFDYVAREVIGYCLDVGCGRNNRFVIEYLGGHGKGIDVYPYEGLTEENLVEDITRFPFDDASFDSVTFIASISLVPEPLRDIEKKSFLTQWGLNHLFVGWKR